MHSLFILLGDYMQQYLNFHMLLSFALQSDSEYMAGQLSAFGYSLTDEPDMADLWLINTYVSDPCD